MEKRMIILWGALLLALIITELLVPVEGFQNSQFVQAAQKSAVQAFHTSELYYNQDRLSANTDSITPEIKESIEPNQHYDIASNLIKYMDVTDNLDKIKEIILTTVDSCKEVTRQAIESAGRAVSLGRQALDYPITIVAEKILTNRQIMETFGIQRYDRIANITGTVNLYVVDDKGPLASIMDRIIGLVGCKKAGGGALYPVGIFVTNTSLDPEVASHEYCHYFQQSVFGFSGWFALYSGEIMFKTTLSEDVFMSYKECTWEIAASDWAERCA